MKPPVPDWEARFAPLFAEQLRRKRQRQAGKSWYVDETYIKVKGELCYLCRAIDRDGQLNAESDAGHGSGATLLSECLGCRRTRPKRVTTDGHDPTREPLEKCSANGSSIDATAI